jgi:8-oxo-dGTP diphosphatase
MAKRAGADTPKDDEKRYLARYRPGDFPRPAVTVDIVIFTLVDADLKVLLVRRNEHPYKGRWALPGGFVRVSDGPEQGEDLDAAAARELAEETGLPQASAYLEQLATFGKSGRDPRMRVISVAYYALVRPALVPLIRPGGDVSHAEWHSVSTADSLALAFDHQDILRTALDRIRARIDESPIAFELVPQSFSIAELRAVFESVKGAPLDPGNFRKRFFRMLDDGLVEQVVGKRITASKPAKVYRFVR